MRLYTLCVAYPLNVRSTMEIRRSHLHGKGNNSRCVPPLIWPLHREMRIAFSNVDINRFPMCEMMLSNRYQLLVARLFSCDLL